MTEIGVFASLFVNLFYLVRKVLIFKGEKKFFFLFFFHGFSGKTHSRLFFLQKSLVFNALQRFFSLKNCISLGIKDFRAGRRGGPIEGGLWRKPLIVKGLSYPFPYEIPSSVTLWGWCRLNAKVSKGNVYDIPHIRHLSHPLPLAWSIDLVRQGLVSAKPVAIGESHVNAGLTEVNKGNIIFYLNHTYTILHKGAFVKANIQPLYYTILLHVSPCVPMAYAHKGGAPVM